MKIPLQNPFINSFLRSIKLVSARYFSAVGPLLWNAFMVINIISCLLFTIKMIVNRNLKHKMPVILFFKSVIVL